MAASTSRAMSSTQCATTPSLHALHNTPMKLLFVRVALGHTQERVNRVSGGPRSVNEEMAASTSRAMSSTQCATTPSLHALHNTPMKLLFVRVALGHTQE